jgi:hypothetical protein
MVLYTLLCGASFYVALLSLVGHRLDCGRRQYAFMHVCLAVAFGYLALSTTPVPLIDFVSLRWVIRLAYTVYLAMLVWMIVRFWVAMLRAWKARRASQ